ncbi:tRNA (cytidine(34)-2'-O)-methyltransferase [Sulfobacillus thermosulfidooxidans]|uniref:tRNA (cytidine(34)-2'-O)-methyltransferase n=1 Tax=Sulfobacillus thermosulfidooxidans TaxID=28034 RepID=UPI00096BAEA0|nr:tRNA (cytidine(34)-2'-O)-methyltransferase [Sulfobacillus thermosulfidooxidans]OLZ09770.1 tRNA (uridine(34)/cytosine(34)/5-carboxymethylaminomethyluridine(34)-2'-O)-methyltransferase TrmL [Sulfobacillus thermosulfidooxidans]OLZ15923.1 tRNA (uridine(34)/cytosine(34)/5-carboxymethylaminomethyluridine(34)-2'-O)-methyltransferase TrmL [Sulfobacillus thermosulfidooxidans]OLZ18229.1 tRNA (uridine(34)/cytosine(34)/5-carboxymethylaminomethyluridine(34)-2'-O)-methyltransferase TrmL [Sulfobacillus ther
MHVVLVEPEIPPNTGNIARTCAATRTHLHLVEPLGFSISDRYLRRAGVDYWDFVEVHVHPDWQSVVDYLGHPETWYYFTSHSSRYYTEARYTPDSVLVFGKESTGLPATLLESYQNQTYVIPMDSRVRSLNLSNAVAIVVYEALRQQNFGPMHV